MAAGWPEVLLLYVFLSSIYFMSKVFYMVLRSWERFGAACAVPLDPRASRAKSVESAEPCDCEPISATAFLQNQRSPVADFVFATPHGKAFHINRDCCHIRGHKIKQFQICSDCLAQATKGK